MPYDNLLNTTLIGQGRTTARDYKDDCYADQWQRATIFDRREEITHRGDFFEYHGDDWNLELPDRGAVLLLVRERNEEIRRHLLENGGM